MSAWPKQSWVPGSHNYSTLLAPMFVTTLLKVEKENSNLKSQDTGAEPEFSVWLVLVMEPSVGL